MPISTDTRTLRSDPLPRQRRGCSPRTLRDTSRMIHLIAAAVLLLHVYGPAGLASALRPALQLFVVPGMSLSGLVLWKQAQIRRLLTRRRRVGQRPATTS
jgi:hypothetical protein